MVNLIRQTTGVSSTCIEYPPFISRPTFVAYLSRNVCNELTFHNPLPFKRDQRLFIVTMTNVINIDRAKSP